MKCIITLIGKNMNHEQKCQIYMRGYIPIGEEGILMKAIPET